MEGDVEFIEGEAVVDLEGEVVQEDGFVSFEQEPVLDFPYGLLLVLGFLVLVGYRFVDVLLFGLVGIATLNHADLLFLVG